jgi:hypothetical protein
MEVRFSNVLAKLCKFSQKRHKLSDVDKGASAYDLGGFMDETIFWPIKCLLFINISYKNILFLPIE